MSLLRILLARALFWCVVKLIETEERKHRLPPLDRQHGGAA